MLLFLHSQNENKISKLSSASVFSKEVNFWGNYLKVYTCIQQAIDNFRIYSWSYSFSYLQQFQEVDSKWIKKTDQHQKQFPSKEFLTQALPEKTLEIKGKAYSIKGTILLPRQFFYLLYNYLMFENRKIKVFHCFKLCCINYFENSIARVVLLLSSVTLRGPYLWKSE